MRISYFNNLLFQNKTVKQTIFKNTFWLSFGRGVSMFFTFILVICATRILGATEFGKFSFALSFTSLFAVFSDLGLGTILIRELSGEEERLKEFYSIISLKFLLGLGMLVLTFIGSFFITADLVIQKIILILALFTFVNIFFELSHIFFQARQRMEYQAGAEIFSALAMMICGLSALLYFHSVESLSYGYLLASLLVLFFVAVFFHFKVFPLKIVWDKLIWKKFLLISWPLAFAGLFGTLYSHIDSVMMGYLGQLTETGWYNAAYRIAWVAYTFTGLVSVSFYPVLSEAFKKSKEKLQKAWNYQTELIIILAFPIMTGGITLAPRIIDFFYGLDFAPSVLAFQILIVMAGTILLYSVLSMALIVSHQQRKFFWAFLSGAIINIILNLILIPKYSLYGAALSIASTHILIFVLMFIFTLKFTPIKPFNLRFLYIFIGVILSSLVMFLIISRPQIYQVHILFLILLGAVVYLVCFLGYKKAMDQLKIMKNYEKL